MSATDLLLAVIILLLIVHTIIIHKLKNRVWALERDTAETAKRHTTEMARLEKKIRSEINSISCQGSEPQPVKAMPVAKAAEPVIEQKPKRRSERIWGIVLITLAIVMAIPAISVKMDSVSPAATNAVKTTATPRKNTANPTKKATARPTATPTAKPTKTPKPTATPGPDYSAMNLETVAESLAKQYKGSAFEYVSVFENDGAVSIDMTLKSFFNEKTAVRDCCTFVLKVSKQLFTDSGAKSLIVNFDGAAKDAYGNSKKSRAIEILIKDSTAKKINYDYMIDHVWSSTSDFLSITDRYYVHPSLQKGVYD